MRVPIKKHILNKLALGEMREFKKNWGEWVIKLSPSPIDGNVININIYEREK